MTAPSSLADCCPQCFPGDAPAVAPLSWPVTEPSGSLCASYACPVCGHEWCCWWDARSAGWPPAGRSAA